VKERRTWFPYERVELHSPLGIDEVQGRLDSIIEPLRWFQPRLFQRQSAKPFTGELGDGGFKVLLWTIRLHKWSAPVVAVGHITSTDTGTCVAVTLRLQVARMLFLAIFLGTMVWSQLDRSRAQLAVGQVVTIVGQGPAIGVALLMLMCGLTIVYFRGERSRAVSLLREALDCPWVGSA